MKLLGDVGYVEPHLFPYGDSVMQDGCTVCAKRIISLEIDLVAPDGTPK